MNLHLIKTTARLVVPLLFALTFVGCPKDAPPKQQSSQSPKNDEPEPLTVLVIEDVLIGEPLTRQWMAETSGKLTIVNRSMEALAKDDFELGREVDIVIYPVDILGELESRSRILPLSRDVWQSDQYNKEELLRIFRSTIPRHRNEIWGVPLGGAMFTLVFDEKIFLNPDTRVPETWEKLLEIVSQSRLNRESGFSFRLPLAEGAAANLFLARSAPLIRTRGRLSTVFERSDMKPLINTQPFRKALNELKELMGDDQSQLDLTPQALFAEIAEGKTKMGITWPPSRAVDGDRDPAPSAVAIGFASLPGQDEWFDPRGGTWNVRGEAEPRQFDLVGFNGLLGSASSTSRSTKDAFGFLSWLGNKSTPLKVLTFSSQSGPFRASYLANPGVWFTRRLPVESALRYGDVLYANHNRDVVFMFPRIPCRQQYLRILDDNVRACLMGQLDVDSALAKIASEWEQLTDSYGRQRMIRELAKDGGL